MLTKESGLRAGVVFFSQYPDDPRVKRETEALVELGFTVDLLCLKEEGQRLRERKGSLKIYRFPLEKRRGTKLRYLWEYALFCAFSFWKLSSLHLKKPYHLVHVHNMPDFLVFSALLPRLTGSKILLDLHDPSPEVFMTKYGLREKSHTVALLKLVEKVAIGFAHKVLTPNIAFKRVFSKRGAPPGKISIVMNSPQEEVFLCRNWRPPDRDPTFRIMFHGTVVERHGLDTALYALRILKSRISPLVFEVFGEGDYAERFKELVAKLNLGDVVRYHGRIPFSQIPSKIASCSVGVIPNKKTPFTELNLPTRIFEYLCMGKPVVAPRTKGILDYFDEQSLFFFKPGDSESLSQALWKVYSDAEARMRILERGIRIYRRYSWKRECTKFKDLVKNLIKCSGTKECAGIKEIRVQRNQPEELVPVP